MIRRTTRGALVAIAATVGLMGASAAAQAAPQAHRTASMPLLAASPDTASGCGGVLAEITVCDTVTGSGSYVDYITGSVANGTQGTFKNLHVRLYGPNGTLYTSPTFTLNSYSTYYMNTQYFDRNVTSGDYCLQLYDGGSSEGTAGCVHVN